MIYGFPAFRPGGKKVCDGRRAKLDWMRDERTTLTEYLLHVTPAFDHYRLMQWSDKMWTSNFFLGKSFPS